jgi:hypothetical protein
MELNQNWAKTVNASMTATVRPEGETYEDAVRCRLALHA